MRTIWMAGEQGSSLWLKERLGCLTASRMADALSFLKGGKEAEARKRLKLEIIAERMTDQAVSRFVNAHMEWGIIQEPAARERYEEVTGTIVSPCGFALHGEIPHFGASPDGLLGEDGLLEIKCPGTENFLAWRMGPDGVPEQHRPQLLAQLSVTNRKWVDFFAFDPRIKDIRHQHFLRRYEPKQEEIAAVEEAARKFLEEVDELFHVLISEESA